MEVLCQLSYNGVVGSLPAVTNTTFYSRCRYSFIHPALRKRGLEPPENSLSNCRVYQFHHKRIKQKRAE